MTKKSESLPASVGGSLDSALVNAGWISPSDEAAVTMARRLALMIDVAFDSGDVQAVNQLAPRLTALLVQLHLTVETRIAGKQEQESDGSEHRDNYLRLLNPKTG